MQDKQKTTLTIMMGCSHLVELAPLTRDTQNAYVTTLTDGTLTQNRTYNNFGEITEVSDNTFTYQLTNRDNAGAITQKTRKSQWHYSHL